MVLWVMGDRCRVLDGVLCGAGRFFGDRLGGLLGVVCQVVKEQGAESYRLSGFSGAQDSGAFAPLCAMT